MPRRNALESTAPAPEKAVLVGVDMGRSAWSIEDSLAELERLAQTDGADTVATLVQKLDSPVPRTFIGKGKADELKQVVSNTSADVVIFDDELNPSQQANLEKILGDKVKVIDRTALILDIFGRHAKTKEGKLQVQLAQLQYVLPRLRGMWSHLVGEQTRGGIGSRFGQGESQLEVDRRLIRSKIQALKKELKRLDSRRELLAKARSGSGLWRVALVGYTNAGKSTLLNALCDSEVYVQDELFATLDPTTRSLELSEGRNITLTDTVGFIAKLPTLLVEAFKSTLAEVVAADLLLLVVDAHDPHAEKEIAEVRSVLEDIEADSIETVLVFNKCDLIEDEELSGLKAAYPDAVFISALEKSGLEGLLFRIATEASKDAQTMTLHIPYKDGNVTRMIHERCQVIHEQYDGEGVLISCKVPRRLAASLERYECEGGLLEEL